MSIQAKKILAIKLRKLSELVVWTGALQSLRQAYPEAEIHVLIPEEMSYVFKDFPVIQKVHLLPLNKNFALIKTLWKLRRENFDLALAFDSFPGLSRWLRLTRAKVICAHEHLRKKKNLTSHLGVDNPGELADNLHLDSKVLFALGIQNRILQPRMFVPERLRKQAFERMNFSYDNRAGSSKVALLPGAHRESKRYPRDLWLQMLDALLMQKDITPAVFADKALAEEWNLRAECYRRGVRLYDDLKLADLLSYLSWFQVAVCNDSASLHLASSVGVRTLGLFGPGNLGREHGYPREAHYILRNNVDCRTEGPRENEKFQHCSLEQCSHMTCLRNIAPSRVVRGVRDLMDVVPHVHPRKKA